MAFFVAQLIELFSMSFWTIALLYTLSIKDPSDPLCVPKDSDLYQVVTGVLITLICLVIVQIYIIKVAGKFV